MEDLQKTHFNDLGPNDRKKTIDHVLNFGSVMELEELLDNGMDPDQVDWQDRTALMMCSAKGRKDAVEMLIARGSDVNRIFMYQGRIPKTALDAAIETRKKDVEDILREHGAKTAAEIG